MATILIDKNVMVPMRDGVRLATDVYRLEGAPPEPVLLARTPYDKEHIIAASNAFDILRAVQAGYVVVIQDVRGRFASEGEFNPQFQEGRDGVDTIAWTVAQPWSRGIVGTFGGSYLGCTQWLAAREQPQALRVMAPMVTPSDMYEGESYQGGANVFHSLRWAVSISRDEIPRRVAGGWVAHPTADAYWRTISPCAGYEQINAPALNISGWYDIFLWGTFQNYQGMRQRGGTPHARQNQCLVIGPWSHSNFTGSFPEREFGTAGSLDALDLTGLQLRWFDRWLREVDNGIEQEPPVTLFVMGIDRWRAEADWPLPDTQYRPYYLHSTGQANTLHGDGSLSVESPGNEVSDVYLFIPLRPVPTVGGQFLFPGGNAIGPRDQRGVETRDDVLVYSSPVLD